MLPVTLPAQFQLDQVGLEPTFSFFVDPVGIEPTPLVLQTSVRTSYTKGPRKRYCQLY